MLEWHGCRPDLAQKYQDPKWNWEHPIKANRCVCVCVCVNPLLKSLLAILEHVHSVAKFTLEFVDHASLALLIPWDPCRCVWCGKTHSACSITRLGRCISIGPFDSPVKQAVPGRRCFEGKQVSATNVAKGQESGHNDRTQNKTRNHKGSK